MIRRLDLDNVDEGVPLVGDHRRPGAVRDPVIRSRDHLEGVAEEVHDLPDDLSLLHPLPRFRLEFGLFRVHRGAG